jgi:hypothetical protein
MYSFSYYIILAYDGRKASVYLMTFSSFLISSIYILHFCEISLHRIESQFITNCGVVRFSFPFLGFWRSLMRGAWVNDVMRYDSMYVT